MKTPIVNLGLVRDLLSEWDKVRQHILVGDVDGWQTALHGRGGKEAIYLGGVYKDDPQAALRAALRMSAARTLDEEDDPPKFANSR